MKPIIRVENLSKQYRIGAPQASYATLRETLTGAFRAPLNRLRGNGHSADNTIWALKDVSFEVMPGEVIGIIGRNGAGKSTLLKILSRITEPTSGAVDLYGRVGSLLEVGTGFHPELTGRENIYLNGAILGMRQKEIGQKFEEIVEFAEIGKFLDTPVKHYSSGMYTRLAFSVAAHLEPEVLLVDEVLAVGDAAFQKKCLGKMDDVAKQGRTVLFVSHNISAIKKICPRSFLMAEGRLVQDGDSSIVMGEYIAATNQKLEQFDASRRQVSSDSVKIRNAYLVRDDGSITDTFLFGDSVALIIQVEVLQPTKFCAEVILRQAEGVPVAFAPSGLAYDWEIEGTPGLLTIKAQLPPLKIASGMYSIDIILGESGVRFLDYIESAISFFIDHTAIGKMNWRFSQSRGQGYCLWDVSYSLQRDDELNW